MAAAVDAAYDFVAVKVSFGDYKQIFIYTFVRGHITQLNFFKILFKNPDKNHIA